MTKSKGIIINRKPRGEAERFFFEQIQIETDNCIEWKYLRRGGYGELHFTGLGDGRAHNVALQIRVTRPNSKMIACHTCHNRACFNYKHLYWGTRKDNSRDMIKDGTRLNGSKNHQSRLNEEQVRNILKDVRPQRVIAKDYGVCQRTINVIKNRIGWKHV